MGLDLSDVVSDADLAEPFTVLRKTGDFVEGGFSVTSTTTIPFFGVVSIAKGKELDQVPEGDRIEGAIVIHTTQQAFVTNEGNSQLSDIVVWHGENWRIINTKDYSSRGFWWAIATRMAGN